MDCMLFPDEALAVLRRARCDSEAERGFNRLTLAFLWSDELVHRVREICADHDSRANSYLLAYRASLILGEPIEELRAPWEQLKRACPKWPGFRSERCSIQLARALKRERTRERLFSSPVGFLIIAPLLAPLFPLMFALPVGMSRTAMQIEELQFAAWFWLGLVFQLVGIVFWEALFCLAKATVRSFEKWDSGKRREPGLLEMNLFAKIPLLAVQIFAMMPIITVLDCGVHARACSIVYLIYEIPALLLVVVRWKRWTLAERLFFRWGWVPIISFGVPLLLPTLKALGWVGGIR